MQTRLETPADFPQIREINRLAFDGDGEADLIEALRADGAVTLSLVRQDEEGLLVGHILFSDLELKGEGREIRAVALAPMAVRLHAQGQGVGSTLIREGLAILKDLGIEVVVVLGHPDFYPKFGFKTDLAAQRLDAPFNGEAFMALELKPGSLTSQYTVTYAKAFNTF